MGTLHLHIRGLAVRIVNTLQRILYYKSSCQVITIDIVIYQSFRFITNETNSEKAHVSQRKAGKTEGILL